MSFALERAHATYRLSNYKATKGAFLHEFAIKLQQPKQGARRGLVIVLLILLAVGALLANLLHSLVSISANDELSNVKEPFCSATRKSGGNVSASTFLLVR